MFSIVDLHVHSRYAGACSRDIDLGKLEYYARMKGVNVLGTGDFQHPKWHEEIKEKLHENDEGILLSKKGFPFIWQTEISLVFTQDGKGRRVHLLLLSPNGEVSSQVIESLSKKGRMDYDGRPIFGMSCVEFVERMMEIDKDIEIITPHSWTSWFGVFGSKSGFDSLKECFQDKVKHIHSIETGMSSNPEMNRRLSQLDNVQIVSFSDLHSYWPWRLGREATIFDGPLSYQTILKGLRTGEGLLSTIETYEVYGKYHYDGHRACGVVFNPEESRKHKRICPKCGKELTIGVMYRVLELADREKGVNVKPFSSVLPLHELIAAAYGIKQMASKQVWAVYQRVIQAFGNEFKVLLEADESALSKVVDPKLARVIIKNRTGNLEIKPGYDGVYGSLTLAAEEKVVEGKQRSLGEFH